MKLQQETPKTISQNLLRDCLDFYPIFHRWPTYKEVVDWSDFLGGTVSLPTFRAVIGKARKIYNEQFD